MKRILALSGSTRSNSSNWRLLQAVSKLYQSQAEVCIYSGLEKLPHFNPNSQNGQLSTMVEDFIEQIQIADGLLICTPEYVFSPPAVLKNTLEWTVSGTVFSHKPVAMIVASSLGEKTFESLDLILATLVQEALPVSSKLLIQGSRGKMTPEGTFSDPATKAQVIKVVDSLLAQIETKAH